MHQITRRHEICAGHRVYGHENKCAFLHGHAYVIDLTCEARKLDGIGRVIDFSVIKDKLCGWLEEAWDHAMLLWAGDPLAPILIEHGQRVVTLPVNPTAENLAMLLVEEIGPAQFAGLGVSLVECTVFETSKCSATYRKGWP